MLGLLMMLAATPVPTGWHEYVNVRFGYRFCYPAEMSAGRESDNSDGRQFSSADGANAAAWGSNNIDSTTLAQEIEDEASDFGSERETTYRSRGDNWAVVSGVAAGKIFYLKVVRRSDQFVAFKMTYPASANAKYGPVVARMSRCFTPLKPGF